MFAGGKKETQASGFPQPVRTTQDRCASSLLESAQKAQSACRVRLQPSSSWMWPALEPAPALRRPAKANGAAPARRSLCLPFLSSTFIFNLRPAMVSTRSPSPPGPATQSRPLLLPLPEGEAETAGPAPASALLVPPGSSQPRHLPRGTDMGKSHTLRLQEPDLLQETRVLNGQRRVTRASLGTFC